MDVKPVVLSRPAAQLLRDMLQLEIDRLDDDDDEITICGNVVTADDLCRLRDILDPANWFWGSVEFPE